MVDFTILTSLLLILAMYKIIPIILTFACLIGFILSILIIFISNVLIAESVRTELNLGKPRNLAVKHSFNDIWYSLKIANVSIAILSVVTLYFGKGVVRGLGISMLVGVLVNIFSLVFVFQTLSQVVRFGNQKKEKILFRLASRFRKKRV